MSEAKCNCWRAHSVNYAKGESAPNTIETLQAAWDRDQELIEDQRIQISKGIQAINDLRQKLDSAKADARRWRCVRNAIPLGSPYAVWREGSHVVLGKDADQMVDNFLSSCKEFKSE